MTNMTKILTPDLCIIGGGSGGLATAAAAARFGVACVLIEKGKMGGDCLNYGCIPSKALIAAAKHAKAMTTGEPFGVKSSPPDVDFAAVHQHVHNVIAAIAPHDSVERFESLGVTVIQEAATFVSPTEIAAGDYRVKARRFVIATGSTAGVPPIPGLGEISYLTNETIFDLTAAPEHLIIIGGGPIGIEMAQAHARLGCKVTVLEAFAIMGKDDPELTKIALDSVREDGVTLREGVKITMIRQNDNSTIDIDLDKDGAIETITGTHLLVAAGRRPNSGGLGLDEAGVTVERGAIKVDPRLRTSNRRIYAIGDVAGLLQFTHAASYHAGIVIRSALFRLPAKVNQDNIPWTTYTDPELAHIGMTEKDARAAHGDKIRVLRWPLSENDRAQAERTTKGLIKITTSTCGEILGVSIVAPHAGDLLHPWILARSSKLKIRALTEAVVPYPTLSEISKRAAGSYFESALFSPRIKKIIALLARLG